MELLRSNKLLFEKVFKQFPQFILRIHSFTKKVGRIPYTKNCKKEKNTFMKLTFFEKDLQDDIILRGMLKKEFQEEEIWQFVYFSVILFSILEENYIDIKPIKLQNFLISDKKLMFYCENLFEAPQNVK